MSFPPTPLSELFQIHGSKLKLHPVSNLGQACVSGISHAPNIGTAADTSETTTTVYGAMKYFIEKLRYLQETYNPKMVFGFALPPQGNLSGRDGAGGRSAMKAVLDSDEYAAPYVDMWKASGIPVLKI